MQKPISVANAVPIKIVIVTMDDHLTAAVARARIELKRDFPGLSFAIHAAADWGSAKGEADGALKRCISDIETGDIIVAAMLFLDDQISAVLPALQARRDTCDAMIAIMSAPEVSKLTRMGSYKMGGPQSLATSLLKKLRGNTKGNPGAKQMKMLRRLPQILRFIPGTAQDVRAYFLTMQYWLAGSQENVVNLVRFLVDRYADGDRRMLRGKVAAAAPVDYPETGIYHPAISGRIAENPSSLPKGKATDRGTVGLLVMRSYLLAGNTAHYDGVIAAIEDRGFKVIPAFASGLDARPAIEQYFEHNGKTVVDAMVSLTGFSLVGGPAYNDAKAAGEVLARLDVPYIAAHPVEFQTLQEWGASERGLLPVEGAIMVAIPELDGATGPTVFGGRVEPGAAPCQGCNRGCSFASVDAERSMHVCPDRAEMLAARVAKLVDMRRTKKADRKVAIVLFNFPPNAGNTGTAAYLSVFESLFHILKAMREEGYKVDLPASVAQLRESIINGNSSRYGSHANVHARIPANDHVRRERYLNEIEAQWGHAPGRQQSDGSSIQVLGERFGNVFVGIQPAFGYEGDPMRLLFEKGFAPTHAFSAFYRWIREDFGAHAALHFGTHGALEFMPGKQMGMSGSSWPDRLIGDLPNIYLYASNNPSEGAIAKRRSAATLISYLTPPIAHAGLYRGLLDLKVALERWRSIVPQADGEKAELAKLIQTQAAALDLVPAVPAWEGDCEACVRELSTAVLELEYTLIPHGLHVVGVGLSAEERIDMLLSIADASHGVRPERAAVEALVNGETALKSAQMIGGDQVAMTAMFQELAKFDGLLAREHEITAILRALDGRFIAPAQGGDVLRTPAVLPTGRNLHGFDPFRIPSAFALADGARQAKRILDRHMADGNRLPQSVAVVLWGADNIKNEGGPIGQALALMGAAPRFDGYGRLVGAVLTPLAELGRPRIDVVMTLSGIFRDLLPLQTKLLAEAAFIAASADEPLEMNFVRKNALEYQALHGCDLETAALRVFSNADGAYGSNVNHLIENGAWDDEDELAETYTRRKCFAFDRKGEPMQQATLLKNILAGVELTYQNLESVEVGVTSLDQYFDTLGGISRAVKRASGKTVPVYIGDQTRSEGTVRTLGEQVALETRTRMLNPKWYEGMLNHGYEGVRQIEEHVRNTVGWSATTGQVAPWVYRNLTETFVLDPAMRERMSQLNPHASSKLANRLIEAVERNYWTADEETLQALRNAGEELEDRVEGIKVEAAA